MARAAGCKTYKLKFGNRGHNQPVKDMLTDQVLSPFETQKTTHTHTHDPTPDTQPASTH